MLDPSLIYDLYIKVKNNGSDDHALGLGTIMKNIKSSILASMHVYNNDLYIKGPEKVRPFCKFSSQLVHA